jgi:hypothetical protein
MSPLSHWPIFSRGCLPLVHLFFAAAGFAATTRSFDITAGTAEKTLQLFAAQSDIEILFSTESVRGVLTNAVRGNFAVDQAGQKMLSGTPLYLLRENAVFRIARAPDPNARRAAQSLACDRPE